MSDDTIARVLAVVIAILAFCLLALAVNTTMWPVRALQGELQVVIVICRMIAHLCCLFLKYILPNLLFKFSNAVRAMDWPVKNE